MNKKIKILETDFIESPDDNLHFKKSQLKNGLTILTEESEDAKSFAIGFALNAGSRNDSKGFEGLAHFFEHIAFRRTRNKTGRKIAEEFESMGAYINAYTTKELTIFYVRALNRHFAKCFNLLAEVIFHPALNAKDIERECEIILEEISSYEDDPEELIFDLGESIVYKGTRLEHPIAGTASSVKKIGTGQLSDYHKKNFSTRSVIISYAGSLNHDEIIKYAEKLDLKPSPKKDSVKPDVGTYKNNSLTINKQFQQSHILLLTRTEGFSSSDRYPLGIINIILGDGLSSRLNQKLREKHGLVYTAYSTLNLLADTGTLCIYAAAENKKLDKIEAMIYDELDQIVKTGFTEKEISKAREQLKSSTIMALEGLSARMQSNARTELATGKYETLDETIKLVDSTTNEDIELCIKKYLATNNWSEVKLIGIK